MKKESSLILAVLLICGTVLLASHNLKSTESISSSQKTISVNGEGQVSIAPDIVNIRAGVSEIADTTKEAQKNANKKLNEIIDILAKNDVPKKNVQTSNLSFRAEYDWSESGRELIGQRVSQTLNIKIPDIDENPDRTTDILDALGNIDGLELNSVQFDLDDKEAIFSKAREEAFSKAKQKAEELASLGNVILLNPVNISESSVYYDAPLLRNYAKMEMASDQGLGGGSSLPSGELEITANVNVQFAIK